MARVLVAGKYQLLKKIGAGSFGKIFLGVTPPRPPIGECIQTESPETSAGGVRACEAAETTLAVKIMSIEHSALHNNEVAIYEKIREIKSVPTIFAAGTEGKFNYIVMDLLEQSVEELFINYGEKLPLKVVIHLAVQMLTIVEQIHACGVIHRDLKPANFLLKTNSQQISELYLIDFGLAKCFLDEKNRHCAIKTNETIVGTTRYMSLNTHHGLTASRRDDLESIGYIMLFLYNGKLSWQNQDSVAKVAELKQIWQINSIGASNSIGEFFLFVLYCRNLDFADRPNYEYLRGLLTNLNKL